MRDRHRIHVAATVFCVAVAAVWAWGPRANGAAPAIPAYPDNLTFEPGREIKVDDPQTVKGGLEPKDTDPTSHFTVYIPTDYDASRSFPLILVYHGLNQDPSAWPCRDLTEGKGYIIVGMEYLRPACYQADPKYELGYVQRLALWLQKSKVNVDTKMIFMAGFSQGGWHTAETCDEFAASLAGVIICSAGRDAGGPQIPAYRGMPILISAGEKEDNRASAESAVKYFKAQGADVTYVLFPNGGHAVDTNSPDMHQWFKDNGEARQVHVSFAAAQKAQTAGELGQAYTLYSAIAKNPAAETFKDKAETAAAEIETAAKQKLDDAEAAITAKNYANARKMFAAITAAYAGSTFADTAKGRIDYLDKDLTIRGNVKQTGIDTRADALEALALAAERSADYARVFQLYNDYLSAYPTSHRIAEVTAHFAALKADPKIAAADQQNADRDGRADIQMANNYISAGRPDLARPFLQEIITKYPTSDWATKAKAILDSIK